MSTKIRAVISESNPSYISKHRYYELKHYCLQYPEWVSRRLYLRNIIHSSSFIEIHSGDRNYDDHISTFIDEINSISKNIELVEACCNKADSDIAGYILEAVTTGKTYSYFYSVKSINCSRSYFYKKYRQFFYFLNIEK
jgi:hypothetical protein